MRLLAEAYIGLDRCKDAAALMERALALAPSFAAGRHTLATALFRQSKNAEALPHLERLVAGKPRDVAYRTMLGASLALLGRYDRAIEIYEGIIADAPGHSAVRVNYGNALRQAGRRDDAVRAYRACLDIAPAVGEAYWNLANLKTEAFSADDIAAMRQALAGGDVAVRDRVYLHYALGHALEQSGEYAGSFAHYAEGAKLRRGQITYSAEAATDEVRRAASLFTPAFFAARADYGCADPAPIFIVGMPRAGSTLIEQILSSHSAVEGTRELPEIGNIVADLAGGQAAYPACLAGLDRDALAAVGERYIERTRVYRRTDRRFFIDKNPTNWAHVGLIHLILPHARIIDARRAPMASCFAAFKQYFVNGMAFSYDLTELGRYYNDYVALMAHFETALPGRIYRVLYEDMVDHTDAEIRRLLDYCELPFEAGCLRFWETRRAVVTPSSEQVRRPIFRESVAQWRHYAEWLGALEAVLRSTGGGEGRSELATDEHG
jgi:tetratricopeptide (TPR) repeat protein